MKSDIIAGESFTAPDLWNKVKKVPKDRQTGMPLHGQTMRDVDERKQKDLSPNNPMLQKVKTVLHGLCLVTYDLKTRLLSNLQLKLTLKCAKGEKSQTNIRRVK